MRNWTPEARKAQAEAIRRWQPWKNSTGPRSLPGKARSCGNARKHGHLSTLQKRAMAAALRRQNYFRRSYEVFLKAGKNLNLRNRTIMTAFLKREADAVIVDLYYAILGLADDPGDARCPINKPALSPCGIRLVA